MCVIFVCFGLAVVGVRWVTVIDFSRKRIVTGYGWIV